MEILIFSFGVVAGVVAARLWWSTDIFFGKHIVRRNRLQEKLFGKD